MSWPARASVVVGLGGNLGDRLATLSSAARAISELGHELRVSPVYETEPLGPAQPRFLNAAVRFWTALEPEPLLDALLEIERAHGRVRRERWGPRTLDLDILAAVDHDGTSLGYSSERLSVPHPGLQSRSFALAPLLDVMPEAGAAYHERLEALGGRPAVWAHLDAAVPWPPPPGQPAKDGRDVHVGSSMARPVNPGRLRRRR